MYLCLDNRISHADVKGIRVDVEALSYHTYHVVVVSYLLHIVTNAVHYSTV